MQPAYLGEFEQLLLLAVLRLGSEAFAPDIARELEARADRSVSRGHLYTSLDRLEEAEDSYERYVHTNTSSVEGFTKLARVRKQRGDREGARAALDEAISTFWQVPAYKRRLDVGWWLRAHLSRLLM